MDYGAIHYADWEYLIATTQLLLAMVGVGALLTVEDIRSRFRQPKSLLIGLALQWLALPLLAVISGALLPVPTGIAVGFLLIAVVPTGVTGNVLTVIGRGNVPLAVSLTAITTIAALVMVPLMLHTLVADYLSDDFVMPYGHLLRDIVFYLLLPLGVGMFCKARLSESASARLARLGIRASLALIGIMAIGAATTGRLDPQAYGVMGILALVLFCLLIQSVAFLSAVLWRLPAADRLAILIKSNYRNISLAVALKVVLFPAQGAAVDPLGDAVFFTILLYGGVSLFASLTQVAIHRWLSGPK